MILGNDELGRLASQVAEAALPSAPEPDVPPPQPSRPALARRALADEPDTPAAEAEPGARPVDTALAWRASETCGQITESACVTNLKG